MNSIKDFELLFDENKHIYREGDTIEGILHLSVLEELKFRGN